MSNYYLQPDISTWQTQVDPFIASILAYDDNNKRISNKQLYIKYAISYDNTEPDLENGQIVYSNKDGVIELHLEQRCRISIDLYMVSEYDESIDLNDEAPSENYIYRNICNNLLLPFEPFITSFEAKYTSDQEVSVNDKVPRKYVQVITHKSDNSVARFTIEKTVYNDYILSPDTIYHINDNVITVSYYDKLLDKTWSYDIIVVGKVQETSIYAVYNGEEKQLNNLVPKTEISVNMVIFDGEREIIVPLTIYDWEFTTLPQITNINLGHLTIAHNDLTCDVFIPFKWEISKFRLDAWYEGYPVLVGNKFVPDDFRIYLYDDHGLRQLIRFDNCQIQPEEYIIHKDGINWFTVLYRVGSYTLQDKVAIIGYNETAYIEDEFKMYFLDPNLKTFTDITGLFDDTCIVGGRRYFNWSKILSRIVEIARYGTYKLYAPVLTGLSTRCDTEWIINCDSRKGIRSKLIKNHVELKEDQSHGKN